MDHKDFDISALGMGASGFDSFLEEGQKTSDLSFEGSDVGVHASSLDAFLEDDPLPSQETAKLASQDMIKVSSIRDLVGFRKVAQDTLVRKSEQDLWKLRESEDGGWVIERLFDDDGNPLKV